MAARVGIIGFWCGLAAAVATIAFDVVQLMQIAGLLRYPLDEILIYATSLCIVLPFLFAMLAFHHLAPPDRQFWTHGALLLSLIYAVFVSANYVVQLATVIPANLGGAADAVQVLEQTPHSLFWNYDAIGYISMGLATLVAVPALDNTGFERWVRLSFLAHAMVTPLITIVYFYPTFSESLLMLGLAWAITAPLFMIMLAVYLRRKQDGEDAIRSEGPT